MRAQVPPETAAYKLVSTFRPKTKTVTEISSVVRIKKVTNRYSPSKLVRNSVCDCFVFVEVLNSYKIRGKRNFQNCCVWVLWTNVSKSWQWVFLSRTCRPNVACEKHCLCYKKKK